MLAPRRFDVRECRVKQHEGKVAAVAGTGRIAALIGPLAAEEER
jgi:hypothetical protein